MYISVTERLLLIRYLSDSTDYDLVLLCNPLSTFIVYPMEGQRYTKGDSRSSKIL